MHCNQVYGKLGLPSFQEKSTHPEAGHRSEFRLPVPGDLHGVLQKLRQELLQQVGEDYEDEVALDLHFQRLHRRLVEVDFSSK